MLVQGIFSLQVEGAESCSARNFIGLHDNQEPILGYIGSDAYRHHVLNLGFTSEQLCNLVVDVTITCPLSWTDHLLIQMPPISSAGPDPFRCLLPAGQSSCLLRTSMR